MSSKSEMIRVMLRSNPNMGVEQCVTALRKQGVAIKKGLYYNVKATMKQPAPIVVNNQVSPLSVIKCVKDLARNVGGMKNLADLVEAMR